MLVEQRVVPLTCHGHSRPVTHLSFSPTVDHDQFYMISGCKGSLMQQCGWIGVDHWQTIIPCFEMVSQETGKEQS